MIVKQNADCSITFRRFDTGENITIDAGQEVDVDEETARYLVNFRCSLPDGANAADLVCDALPVINVTAEADVAETPILVTGGLNFGFSAVTPHLTKPKQTWLKKLIAWFKHTILRK